MLTAPARVTAGARNLSRARSSGPGRSMAATMNIASARAAGGRPLRRRDYPGWRMVWALAVTETISYGVLYYSFAAFLLPMQQSLGYGQATLTGAFSLSVLVTGAGAIPADRK